MRTLLSFALLLASSSHALADQADASPSIFSFSGFGTVGLAHSSEDHADFVANLFVPNGVGHSRHWSPKVDSRFGAQLSAAVTPQLSFVVQLVAEQRVNDKYKPKLEWANVKYLVTPDFSVRLGRIAMASYLVSDTRKVGYTYPWARTPVGPYSLLPFTNSDGVDVSYRLRGDGWTSTTTALYGRTDSGFPDGTPEGAISKLRDIRGLINRVEAGHAMLQMAYQAGNVSSERIASIPVPAYAAMGRNSAFRTLTVGAAYDAETWFAQAEWAKTSLSFLGDSSAWYVSAGRRYGNLTPYLAFERQQQLTPPGVPFFMSTAHHTWSAGLRWDFRNNLDLKLQYDRVKVGAGAGGNLVNIQPAFDRADGLGVVSATLDFVF